MHDEFDFCLDTMRICLYPAKPPEASVPSLMAQGNILKNSGGKWLLQKSKARISEWNSGQDGMAEQWTGMYLEARCQKHVQTKGMAGIIFDLYSFFESVRIIS